MGYDPRSATLNDAFFSLTDGQVLARGSGDFGTSVYGSGVFTTTVQTHTSGTSLTVNSTSDVVYVDPSTALSSLTITLPTPTESTEIEFHFGGTIAALNPVVNVLTLPSSVVGGNMVSAAVCGDSFTLRYNTSNSKWYF